MVEIIGLLVGRRISEVVCGAPSGSVFYLEFPDGDEAFCVNCAWRLDHGEHVLTGWRESNDGSDSPLVSGLRKLTGATIEAVDTPMIGAIRIIFSSGHALFLLCDLTPQYDQEGDANWKYLDPANNKAYLMDRHLTLKEVPYE